jgi:glutamyl-tRNA synthetase
MEVRQLEELRWLGLEWDEGPDLGGPCGPYRQSELGGRYEAALEALRAAARAYPCFCSRAEIAAAASAPHGPGDEGPAYPGTCRGLPAAEVARRRQAHRLGGRGPAWRLAVEAGPVRFEDGVHGPCAFEVADFVVARADGIAAYQLAVAVDDAAMGVTDVVRGDDLLPSTARQLLVYRALGLAEPRFAHVPLVVGEDGERLAKRHAALSLGELKAGGAEPRVVVGFLAALSGLCPPGEAVGPGELVPAFALARIPKRPAVAGAGAVARLAGPAAARVQGGAGSDMTGA